MYLTTESPLVLTQSVRPLWVVRRGDLRSQGVSRVPPQPTGGMGALLALVAAGWLLSRMATPARRTRRRRPNREPLEPWKRDAVSRRDGWRCTYCDLRVTRRTRHIDHSRCRRNGGTNLLRNLRLSCAPCNLEKGARDAQQFAFS